MVRQMQEPQAGRRQSRKQFPWVLWIVLGIVLIAILGFSVGAFLVSKSQVAIISTVATVVISLVSALLAFLQWFYPRNPGDGQHSTHFADPSQPTSPMRQISPSPTFLQQPVLPPQLVSHPGIEPSPLLSPVTIEQGEQAENAGDADVHVPHKLHQEDWDEAPHLETLYGREQELAGLKQWIVEDHCRMVTVLGIGGIGKTALIAKLTEQIKDEFEYVFWRSLQNAPPLETIPIVV